MYFISYLFMCSTTITGSRCLSGGGDSNLLFILYLVRVNGFPILNPKVIFVSCSSLSIFRFIRFLYMFWIQTLYGRIGVANKRNILLRAYGRARNLRLARTVRSIHRYTPKRTETHCNTIDTHRYPHQGTPQNRYLYTVFKYTVCMGVG